MATSGPMLIAQLQISLHRGKPLACPCGRASTVFYKLWLGMGGEAGREPEEVICSFCAGERITFVPNGMWGKKLVLQPDPNATLTDDERGDVVSRTVSGFDLEAWAKVHGSRALRFRIDEGLEWERFAEFQWAREAANLRLGAAFEEAPQWIDRLDAREFKFKPRMTPTDREVDVLMKARAAFCNYEPMVNASVGLIWAQREGEAGQAELEVAVPLPTGRAQRLFYTIPQ